MLLDAALTAERDVHDPLDAAILAALGRPVDGYEMLELEPFDADRKRAEARMTGAMG